MKPLIAFSHVTRVELSPVSRFQRGSDAFWSRSLWITTEGNERYRLGLTAVSPDLLDLNVEGTESLPEEPGESAARGKAPGG